MSRVPGGRLIAALVVAATSQATAAAQDTLRHSVIDRPELEAFLDGLMIAHLSEKNVAGATFALVKDGQLLFAQGYGYTDVDRRTPVDAERSLFRIGSVSKLFTWTMVMQLVEQGKLDLDADVNQYLDFAIPATYPDPITLRHVMTHTPGFEDRGKDLFTEDSTQVIPLGRWLATHIPARVRPPGQLSVYSNYATALAGYIVERVSGISWDDYLEQRILQPLGMNQTTGRQPLPQSLAPLMSQGYEFSQGRHVPQKFEIVNGASPAGSISASAVDMSRFMLAHLGGGALGEVRILGEETARQMYARAFGHDPRLPGFCLGFYEKSSHGLRIIGHGGDTQWFHTDLALIPEENLGLFVSYNTASGGDLSFGPFLEAFLDHYYPDPPPPLAPSTDLEAIAAGLVGTYRFNRMSYTTVEKAGALAGAVKISIGDDSTLVLASPFGETRLRQVEPGLFRETNGHELVAFRTDESGRATHAFMGEAPMMGLERVPWSEAPLLHFAVLGLGGVVFVGLVIAAIVRLVRRRSRPSPPPRPLLWGRRMLVGAALVNLAFVVSLGALASSNLFEVLSGPATELKAALTLPMIGGLLTLGALACAVAAWKNGAGTRGARVRYSAAVVVALLFVWSLHTWNLLGWRI